MKTTVYFSKFERAFVDAGRADNFTHDALSLLFDYFEELDSDMELDVTAICCDYSEDTVADIADNYSIDLSDIDPEDLDYDQACIDIVREYLSENTSLVGETSTGFVYANF